MAGFDDLESARYWLRDDFLLAQLAHVPPLTRRVAEGELPTMVISILLAELGSAHRVAGIGKRTALQVTTMLRYPWPFDVAELRCWCVAWSPSWMACRCGSWPIATVSTTRRCTGRSAMDCRAAAEATHGRDPRAARAVSC